MRQAELAAQQAKETANQGKTVLVFTVVTIIFLPLSFMAAFFAINIKELKNDGDGKLPLGYVLKYMITISAAFSIPFIFLAFNQDRLARILRNLLSMVGESLPRASLSGVRRLYCRTVTRMYTPERSKIYALLVAIATVMLGRLLKCFSRRRKKKSEEGMQDSEDELDRAEKGNVDGESVRSETRGRERNRSPAVSIREVRIHRRPTVADEAEERSEHMPSTRRIVVESVTRNPAVSIPEVRTHRRPTVTEEAEDWSEHMPAPRRIAIESETRTRW